ncbi:MAG: glycosyltransferase [Candidatus Latescibacteria bacterium]|nr:glycosyltransferase [Candidatus Latescibacterota bacterium]NIM21094.1 glycosyltransferase [Candidatus Latescibacterota bacterium]NIM65229.1 glycosyltransferase [Candidatus Latescibacterota bacterium]NIO01744.1 glycosyltransferase [Candidatus Latescibacterota bacterium]NIO28261.1 glycosyltransferase [Candidatus Latescibacterota bacterium]
MKVCLVGPVYPYRGGIAHFTSLLAKEFAKDHEISIINFKRLYPSFLFPGKTQFDESGSPLQVESERLIDSMNPFTWILTARAIARRRPDLVVFQWWQPFFAFTYAGVLFFLKLFWKSQVVYLCHNVLPHEASIFDRTLIKIGFTFVNAFLVQSQEDRMNLLRFRKHARVAVNPHPIYDVFKQSYITREEAREKLGIQDRITLFFGYIRPYKGLRVLLEAFAESIERVPSTLLIVGEFYEDQESYISLMEELSIRDKIVLVDRYVPNEEVEIFFTACDIVVLPYLSATQSGIVQIAFGFGKPVIVTGVGGLPDVVEDGVTGYVVPPNDPESLAKAIVHFYSQGDSTTFEENIQAAKDKFSWKRCKGTLVELSGLDAG